VFYGTLEGYLKAVDAKTGKELYKFKTPSGIIGNVTTYENGGRQYVAILSGVGGWIGQMLSNKLDPRDSTASNGMATAVPDLPLRSKTGSKLYVFRLR
jgi:glucose dehydrogenase